MNAHQLSYALIPDSPTEPVLFSVGYPSNFSDDPIEMIDPFTGELSTFSSTEVYFHAVKVARHFTARGDHAGYLRIATASNPAVAKRLARQVPLSPDFLQVWDNGLSFQTMLAANFKKFRTHAHCADWLKATGSRALIEHRPDPIWGDNIDGTGRNWLGLVLMLIRSTLFG